MITIDLKTAINILSLDEYSKMSVDERQDLSDSEDLDYEQLFKYIKKKYDGIKLSYIEERIKNLYQIQISIYGKPTDLFPCPCCNYRTIYEQGNYQICKVCFWEDDGNNNDSDFSSANHMTLNEARVNFEKNGVISDKFLNFINVEEKFKYYKNG